MKLHTQQRTEVQKLYHLGHAEWYDFLRPIWTSLVERGLEEDFIRELKKQVTPHTRIIDLGCGTGINLRRILSLKQIFASYTGIDFSEDMLAIAQQKFRKNKRIRFVCGDLRTVALPQHYDLIISTWVFSHLERPSYVVNRFYQNLSKGGTMLFVFLTKPPWYIDFWFSPLARFFRARPVSPFEVNKMRGSKKMRTYAHGLATFLVITKRP